MNNSTYVILLTACVNPDNMSFTELQNPQVRKEQYLQAVEYYVKRTRYKLVICNNSGDDFGNAFEKLSDRVEYLFFDGNNYNRSLGKGYGEFEIIKYAIQNSQLIKQAQVVIKITGRLIISNLKPAINETRRLLHLTNMTIIARIPLGQRQIYSECIVAPKEFYVSFLAQPNSVNDSEGYYFEHLLYDTIRNGRFSIESFTRPIIKKGVSGTLNVSYHNDHRTYLDQLKEIQLYYREKRRNATRSRYALLLLYISIRMHVLSKYWAFKKTVKNLVVRAKTNS